MDTPTTLLVVEPHENLRDAYASVLRFAGYRVDEASCAVSARARLIAARPEVVLVNLHLPTADDAISLLRRARRERALEATTWVALCEGQAGLNGAQQAEFDAVLHTPLTYTDLVGAASALAGAPGPSRPDPLWEPSLSWSPGGDSATPSCIVMIATKTTKTELLGSSSTSWPS